MNISRQKGCKDILPQESRIWQYIEENIKEICDAYNVQEIRTPVFEATELYARGVGDETDIVNKEMYTFLDKGNRSITLRPELTAGVVRAYIENGMSSKMQSPIKLWYTGNMYRYEKMQKGRYREFSQFGVEIFGSSSYFADLEAIMICVELLKKLNLFDKVNLQINSIGCKECRSKYILKLKEYIKPNLDNMCDTCKVRFEKNPLRILDCKEEKCGKILSDAPVITECLCDECKNDFDNLKNALNKLEIPYIIDSRIVRGLDYYNKTVFEFVSKDLGLAVGGGGRYDTLVSTLGGTNTPAVGFGIGMDRLVILLNEYNLVEDLNKSVDVYVLSDENTYLYSLEYANKLRDLGFCVETNLNSRAFNSQFKYANKIRAKFVLIFAEDEIKENMCSIKNMTTGEQTKIELDIYSIKERIKNA